jgi:hypothetical protein
VASTGIESQREETQCQVIFLSFFFEIDSVEKTASMALIEQTIYNNTTTQKFLITTQIPDL